MAVVEHYPALTRPAAPLVSVCIAHYKGPELIAACLDSVLAQDCAFDLEIIVHDDASPDDSVAFLRKRYPQVELLVSGENAGFCVANNRMVAHARGKFVLLLNNDAALFPDGLTVLADAAAQQDPPGILTLPQYDWESGELVDRGCLLDPFYNPVPNLNPDRRDVAMVIGACLWIEREVWGRLGGFPEWFESVGEDLYLCCAVRLGGGPVEVTCESGYRHRQGHSFGGNRVDGNKISSSYRRRRLSERNKTYVLFVVTPTGLMWPLLGLHILLVFVEGLILTLIRRDGRILREVYANVFTSSWCQRKLLQECRASAQRMSSINPRDYFRTFTLRPRKLTMLWHYGWPSLEK
ncbi:MAG: glycosyl transferase [Haliea sp.]|uniref:glycosyltransferase family 2 protein n=1 Tax=Haliea sp. TaxID=1932666 RepID=UPI000C4BD7FD|nr:glycosyltransferase [Haliea sp.]MBM70876.1 glycosyl transferase [Haliea sp.]|tara:strand:+ start:11609 stop:12661 length:1053 start_codon:yes stop_codon:yes gene_type:complete